MSAQVVDVAKVALTTDPRATLAAGPPGFLIF